VGLTVKDVYHLLINKQVVGLVISLNSNLFSQIDHEFTTVDSVKKKEFIPTLLSTILD
jgi:hypothetical protein